MATLLLYYKSTCPASSKILSAVTRRQEFSTMKYLNLDNYYVARDGQGCVQMPNGQVYVIPPDVRSVPTLQVQMTNGQSTFHNGAQKVTDCLELYIRHLSNNGGAAGGNQAAATAQQEIAGGGRLEFGGFDSGVGGIVSDKYSFIDEDVVHGQELPKSQSKQLHMYDTLAESKVGILGVPLKKYNDQIDPRQFMSPTQMAAGGPRNESDFRIKQTVQNPSQFPKNEFWEGRAQPSSAGYRQDGPMGAQSSAYNGNEFGAPLSQAPVQKDANGDIIVPPRLRPIETKVTESNPADYSQRMQAIRKDRGYGEQVDPSQMQQHPQTAVNSNQWSYQNPGNHYSLQGAGGGGGSSGAGSMFG